VVSCVECEMWTLTRTEMGGREKTRTRGTVVTWRGSNCRLFLTYFPERYGSPTHIALMLAASAST
jgi:hypothetical protein